MHKRQRRSNGKPFRTVFVARTLELPQDNFESFLRDTGADLQGIATLRSITSTHLSLFEVSGIRRAMQASHTEPREVAGFSYELSSKLDEYRARPIEVEVDRDRPLKIFGKRNDKLALNLIDDEGLVEERQRIETILRERFEIPDSEFPEPMPFDPHVTIGHISLRGLSLDAREKTHEMLSPTTVIPESVALNGLRVFLNDKALKH